MEGAVLHSSLKTQNSFLVPIDLMWIERTHKYQVIFFHIVIFLTVLYEFLYWFSFLFPSFKKTYVTLLRASADWLFKPALAE